MPDINEFLDTQLGSDAGDSGAGENDPVLSEAPGSSDLGDSLDTEPVGDVFDRKYVEKLRRESAGYRERAKRYQEAFDGYDEDAVEEWLGYVKNLRVDPKSTAERMADLSKGILEQYEVSAEGEVQAAGTAEAQGEEARPFTESDYKRLRAQEQAADIQRDNIRRVEAQARELGYEVGSKAYKQLLNEALELPDGNIQKAHENLQAERQRIIDEYIAEKGLAAGRRMPAQGVAGGENPPELKTWKDSREALNAFLDGQF